MWLRLLHLHHRLLDFSNVQLDGSHTPVNNGGVAVDYRDCKACCTTNTMFLADNHDQPLAMATLQGGQHHDTFQLAEVFAELCALLEEAELCLDGLFLNADKVFSVSSLRQTCTRYDIQVKIPHNRRATDWQTDDDTFLLDPELYRRRLIIEQLNAWLNGFKTPLVRFETHLHTWLAFHWLAFSVLLLRKIGRPLLPKQFHNKDITG